MKRKEIENVYIKKINELRKYDKAYFKHDNPIISDHEYDKIKQEKIIRSACRAAVKANDVVEVTQMIDILNDLQKLDNPFTCPHGRPTMVKYTLYELEKMFKRVV